MAKKICERCGLNVSSDMVFGVNLCDECRDLYRRLVDVDMTISDQIQDSNFYARSTSQAERLFSKAIEKYKLKAGTRLKEREAYENMMLTTGSTFDGYTVDKYIDVFCEEIIVKCSVGALFNARLEDLVNALSFSKTEMSGANELISDARTYVMEKFKQKAVKTGANAVLGIEFESSYGVDIIRIAVSGTAVIVKKLDNNQ